MVDVSYIGNHGIWWYAPALININAIDPATLAARGLDLSSAADRALREGWYRRRLAVDQRLARCSDLPGQLGILTPPVIRVRPTIAPPPMLPRRRMDFGNAW